MPLAVGGGGDDAEALLVLPARLNITRVRVLPLRNAAAGVPASLVRMPMSETSLRVLPEQPGVGLGTGIGGQARQLRSARRGVALQRHLLTSATADDIAVAIDVEALPGAAVPAGE